MDLDKLIGSAKTVGISAHVRPDGDAIGSTLALYLYIKKNFPEVRVDVFLQKVLPELKFLKGSDEVITDFTTDVDSYDLFIVSDCSKDRTGDAEKFFDNAKRTANIDHHVSNPGTGDSLYIVPEASSACELVYDCLDRDKIDEDIAKAIYTGMVTDTGVFKYNNTSPKTLQIAADLISFGFDFGALIDHVFFEKTYIQNQIMGRALLESLLLMDGRCIVSVVSKQTMDFYGAEGSDLDGIVNQLLLTQGVDCSIFMYELSPLEYKVSLRSTDAVNVAEVAEMFGGGGHVRAAGCTVNGTWHDVINNITKYIEKQLS